MPPESFWARPFNGLPPRPRPPVPSPSDWPTTCSSFGFPGETNVVAYTTGDGVVLVDGVSTGGTDALMKAVAALPGGRAVQTLFNTHWHPEHTGLNEQLGKAGKTIIAHENTRLWLATDVTWPWNEQRFKRLPKLAQPNKTLLHERRAESGR